MEETIFLTIEQLLVIHEDQIERYGGSSGIRDLPLLESALFRPQSSFGGEFLYQSIFNKSAALICSVILNHPFIDGNKRTGVTSGLVFLGLNGIDIKVQQNQLVELALMIAVKKMNIEEVSKWLKEYTYDRK